MLRFTRPVLVVLAAAVAAAFFFAANLDAWLDFDIRRGPLWWVPDNDTSWSRHHDRWTISPVENVEVRGRADFAATSFLPEDEPDPPPGLQNRVSTLGNRRVWLSAFRRGFVSGAPPNSSCDLLSGQGYAVVGPPDRNRQAPDRTSRTPLEYGGAGGLQTSLHIGEYWQGRIFRDYLQRAPASILHRYVYTGSVSDIFGLFGSFDVRVRSNARTWLSPYLPAMGGIVQFPRDRSGPFYLAGGGSGTLSCLGAALVMMHGHGFGDEDDNIEYAYAPIPRDVDDNPCYSTAMLIVLRGNSEGRCEPDLSVRPENYAGSSLYTAVFYEDYFDPATESRTAPELRAAFGSIRRPLFPDDYPSYMAHLIGRRTEYALHTAGEFAQDLPPVPWRTPAFPAPPYPGPEAAGRRARLERLVDPATRPDGFGGEPLALADFTGAPGANAPFADCLEIGDAGWDAATGTFSPRCGPDAYTTPYTGFVNHEVAGARLGSRAERRPEAGPRDNRSAIGATATIRRQSSWAGLVPAPGFEIFRHVRGNLGCVYLAYTPDPGYLELPRAREAHHEAQAQAYLARLREVMAWNCGGSDVCEAIKAALIARYLDLAEEQKRLAFGWRLIGEYRGWAAGRMQGAMNEAGYAPLASPMRFVGVDLDFDPEVTGSGVGQCFTGPVGDAGINVGRAPVREVGASALAGLASIDRADGRDPWLVPSQPRTGAETYYGQPIRAGRTEHEAAGGGRPYTFRSEVRGAATRLAREAARDLTGLGEPYPLDLGHDYSGVSRVRQSPHVFREFACPSAEEDVFGFGVLDLGPGRLHHRAAPPGEGWRAEDSRIDAGDPERRYPTGTPCIPEDVSPLSSRGEPLSRYYNVRGTGEDVDRSVTASGDPAGGFRGHRAALGAREGPSSPVHYLPLPDEPGVYSGPEIPGNQPGGGRAQWVARYSGDGAAGVGPDVERQLEPISYVVLPDDVAQGVHGVPGGSQVMELSWQLPLESVDYGILSLDVEAQEIWSGYSYRANYIGMRIATQEAYAGVAAGYSPDADPALAPADVAFIRHDGPVRFFGAMGLGGSGGCTLAPSPSGSSGSERGANAAVLGHVLLHAPWQRIVCILPVDSQIAAPDGSCPNWSVFP